MIRESKAFDVTVLGMGFAGLAAALFAARRGLRVAICGASGGLDHCSGLIDLLGVYPLQEAATLVDPWAAMARLAQEHPEHPYARLEQAEIRGALAEAGGFLADNGLPYWSSPAGNSLVITPAGTLKPSFLIPASLREGVRAHLEKAPTLLVGFKGLKGFNTRQIWLGLAESWPGLRHVTIPFPAKEGELYPRHLALALAEPEVCGQLAEALRPHAQEAEYVGFPAVLGLETTSEVIPRLEELLRKKVFEIPLLPPSLAGLRVRSAFIRGLAGLGVDIFSQELALAVEPLADGGWQFGLGRQEINHGIQSRGVILATGGFLGQGLAASRQGVRETVFGLPVAQPAERLDWTSPEFFSRAGHPVFSAGLAAGPDLQPLDASGKPVPGLRAAGSILAHHNWTRLKCGAGMSIATAYKAANSLADYLGGGGK